MNYIFKIFMVGLLKHFKNRSFIENKFLIENVNVIF